MKRIYVPTSGPDDWQQFLASPEKHWKTGFSAKTLAYSWEEADGFPKEIKRVFKGTAFEGAEPIFIIPEYPVPLPGGKTPSYNDIFVLARANEQMACIMVEGKVSESFGELVAGWDPDSTPGRRKRLDYILDLLELDPKADYSSYRYQLFHRTASALIEAQRMNVSKALMLVHSFSQENEHFSDYQKFFKLFSVEAKLNQLYFVRGLSGIDLYCGWVVGDPKYLKK